jgi:predicted  nucleic acid-binding Zn-ribbon protein
LTAKERQIQEKARELAGEIDELETRGATQGRKIRELETELRELTGGIGGARSSLTTKEKELHTEVELLKKKREDVKRKMDEVSRQINAIR